MKLLMLSTDRRIFEAGSAVRERMRGYGRVLDELRIIVRTDAKDANGMRMMQISENVFAYRVSYNPFSWYRTARRILRQGGDWVVTTQDPFETGFAGWMLARRFKVPFQLQVHTDFLSPYFAAESWKNRIRVRIAKFLLPRADRIRVVSERIKRSLVGVSMPPVTVLPIFVETEAIRRAPVTTDLRKKYPGRDFIACMASRLEREKNIVLALQAMREVVRLHPEALLVIVGEGPELINLKLRTKDLKLEGNVVFEPWTNDLASYYKTADCFIITSNYEGYGRTAVEALALGLPVVMTDVGLAGEVVKDGENGFVVPVGDMSAFARALERMASDVKLRTRLAHGAAGTRQLFPSERTYLEAYREALTVHPKLCYVAPAWRGQDATHFAYLKEFIKEIAKHFDVYLIVERGELPRDSGAIQIELCDARFALVRMLRTELALWHARRRGCRTFYVHYSFFAAYTASWIALSTGGRVLYWNCGEPWKYRRNFLRNLFERLTYALIDRLVTGTEGMKRAYAKHYALPLEKIAVVPNWIDMFKFKSQISNLKSKELRRKLELPAEKKVVLFVHRLSKRKGADWIPEIAKNLPDDAVLIVVGDGPEKSNIKNQISTINMEERVRFLGWVPQEELHAYYALADLFVLPSEEEGFPHVLLEAMAAGTPFVATDVGGVRDIVPPERYNWIIPSEDQPSFMRAIRGALALPEHGREKYRTQLQEWVSRYNLENAAGAFEKILLEH